MSGIESIGDFDGEIEKLFYWQRLRGDELAESLAFEALHDNDGAALVLPDFMNGADIGVIESGGGTRFTAKAFQGQRIVHQIFRKELQGYGTPERSVFRAVHNTHASATELFHDAVMGDCLIDE